MNSAGDPENPNLHDLPHDVQQINIGALIIRIGFWGRLYYTSNKEPPKVLLMI